MDSFDNVLHKRLGLICRLSCMLSEFSFSHLGVLSTSELHQHCQGVSHQFQEVTNQRVCGRGHVRKGLKETLRSDTKKAAPHPLFCPFLPPRQLFCKAHFRHRGSSFTLKCESFGNIPTSLKEHIWNEKQSKTKKPKGKWGISCEIKTNICL